MSRRPSISSLVLGVYALILLAPVLGALLFRVYQLHLLHQTEAALISESVWVAELYRAYLREEKGEQNGEVHAASDRPPSATDELYPVTPALDADTPLLPGLRPPERFEPLVDTPETRAGRRLSTHLQRVKRFNLSGVRVLDSRGVVVASSSGEIGAVLTELPEVRGALTGRYTVVTRERVSDEPTPPLDSIKRRGDRRVFTALPIFSDGRTIGVVRASRTGIDVLEALYLHRTELFLVTLLCVLSTLALAFALTRAITRPVMELRAAAAAIVRGEGRRPFAARGFVPAELAELSTSLDALTSQLQTRAEYARAFAAQAGHELRSPLTAIRGAAELLRDAAADVDEVQRARFLSHIERDSERMARTIDGLLRLSRLENQTVQTVKSAETETGLVLATTLRSIVAEHGPRIVLSLAADLREHLAIDREHLEAVLNNLLENALRHGAPHEVRVDVQNRPDGTGVQLRITDRGPGISDVHRERIFNRFFTTRRDEGGTGLGLSIVRAIARARGGDVSFVSGRDGTTFRVEL